MTDQAVVSVAGSLIHAFDPERRTNAALMIDCHRLEYVADPVLDLTYGQGLFWTDLEHLDVVANDLDPTKGDEHRDFTATGWPARSFGTVVFDPPYRLGGTPSTPDFDDRYGLETYRSHAEMREMIEAGTTEAVRLAGDFVIVKCQDHVSSGRLQPLTTWVTNAATEAGAVLVDSLHVIGGRAQPSGRRQVRARHGYSTALIFAQTRGRRR